MAQANLFRNTLAQSERRAQLAVQQQADTCAGVQLAQLDAQLQAQLQCLGQAQMDAIQWTHQRNQQRQQQEFQAQELAKLQQQRYQKALQRTRTQQLSMQQQVVNHSVRRDRILESERAKAKVGPGHAPPCQQSHVTCLVAPDSRLTLHTARAWYLQPLTSF